MARMPEDRAHVLKLRLTTDLGRALFLNSLRSLAGSPGNSPAVREYMMDAADLIEVLAAERTATGGEELARKIIDIWEATFDIEAVAAALAAPTTEPQAWKFELASSYTKETDTYSDWKTLISDTPPNAGRGMRNVTPLYAAPALPAPDKAHEEAAEQIILRFFPHMTGVQAAIATALSAAHASGREEGERAMREAAVQVTLEQRCERDTPWDLACTTIADAIRDLPVPSPAQERGE